MPGTKVSKNKAADEEKNEIDYPSPGPTGLKKVFYRLHSNKDAVKCGHWTSVLARLLPLELGYKKPMLTLDLQSSRRHFMGGCQKTCRVKG